MNLNQRLRNVERAERENEEDVLETGSARRRTRDAARYLAQHDLLDTATREDFERGWQGQCAYLHLEVLRARARGDHRRAEELKREAQQVRKEAGGAALSPERLEMLLGQAGMSARATVEMAKRFGRTRGCA